MSLDALAPDQRAVVQLVLQQDRSYGDLAGLLGITEDAVRERAHRGLERIAPGDDVSAGDRAEIADYLLGQQSVSGRETTRALLAGSPAAATWASTLAQTLGPIARSPLPEIPRAGAPAATPEEPVVRSPRATSAPAPAEDEPVRRARPRPSRDPLADDEPVVRARPRPRPTPAAEPAASLLDDTVDTPAAADTGEDDLEARSSLFGGALLIGGLGILVAILIVWLVTKGGDDNKDKQTASTPAATATASVGGPDTAGGSTGPSGPNDFALIGALDLKPTDGSSALGRMAIFTSQSTGQIGFELVGQNLPPSAKGTAYGVWLTGGAKPHFLGYAPPVSATGKTKGQLGTTGPRASDQQSFPQWIRTSKSFVVTKETQQNPTTPGTVVLSGNLADFVQAPTGSATPTATAP